jgi:NitT/TauT family transport system substrate-binding protein
MNISSDKTSHEIVRRQFLSSAFTLGAASLLGMPGAATAQPAPETKRIRLIVDDVTCLAPQYLAEELLRLEGFTQIEYVRMNYEEYPCPTAMVAAGKADFIQDSASSFVYQIDLGKPVVVLGGVHVGCWELIGSARVRAIRDLKGKRIPISASGSEEHLVLSSVLAYVGIDPRRDVEFVTIPEFDDQRKAFLAASVDALFAFPPYLQRLRLRAEKIGHVILDATRDRPWNQYFCCVAGANRDFAARNPVATKRALRAILKAADVCAQDPQRAARYLVDRGYEPSHETALRVLTDVRFGHWREFNPEETLRFHALRLREVGMIKSTPQQLIARGTDWRYLNELKRELKA